jgi:hypothetical protein
MPAAVHPVLEGAAARIRGAFLGGFALAARHALLASLGLALLVAACKDGGGGPGY